MQTPRRVRMKMIKIHDIFLARFVCVFAFAMHLQCISMEIESNCNLILCHMDRFPVEVVVTEKQPYQERTNTWCLAVPPRCSKYQIKFRTVNKTQILMKERVVFECCGNWRLQSFHNDDFSLFPFPYSPANNQKNASAYTELSIYSDDFIYSHA